MLKRVPLALAGLVALGATVALPFIPLERFKPRIETAISSAVGLQVRITGRVRAGLFPSPNATLEEVRVANRQGAELLAVRRFGLRLAWWPLVRGQLRVHRIQFVQPTLTLRWAAMDGLDTDALRLVAGVLGSLDGGSLLLSSGDIRCSGPHARDSCEVRDIALSVKHVRMTSSSTPPYAIDLGFDAEIACGDLRGPDLSLSTLQASVHAAHGVVKCDPVTLAVFGGQLSGAVRVEVSGPIPSYSTHFVLRRARIEEFFRTRSPVRAAEGEVEFTSELTMRGTSASELLQSSEGGVSLRGSNLSLLGNDLDRQLARFKSSEGFNLVDLGAVFFAGPLSLGVTRGYGFASLFTGAVARTPLRTLVSDWHVHHGVVQAKDVAFSTPENRIALQGGLDFVRGRFADLTVAVVDAKGCARLRQTIHGDFAAPEVGKPRVLSSLAGPAVHLNRRARRLFPAGACERFYSGSVPAPR